MTGFPCTYCLANIATRQGLASHIAQSKACRQRHHEAYEAASDSEQASESGNDTEIGDGTAGLGGDADDDTDIRDGDGAQYEDTDHAYDSDGIADLPEIEPPVDNSNARKRPRATVEEVEDEDDRWTQDFPEEQYAGATFAECQTEFEQLREQQKAAGLPPWAPFETQKEWDLARWLMTAGLSGKNIDEYLKLETVREDSKPAFHNNRALLQRVDNLPEGPQWFCHPFELKGDELDPEGKQKTEVLELWHRDPVDCVRELLGNPTFKNQGYAPIRVFKSFDAATGAYSNREYSEMWTADWWWKIQELLLKGSTLVPIIIASDKTQLTRFVGDKQAWPVYLTIGNIDKETRRTPTARATVLLGYIPVSKFEIFFKKNRSATAHQFFHDCMAVMLEALKVAGRKAVDMNCSDGFVRKMFLILAAYIADYPEQCLVCCCRENSCPRCLVTPKCRGEKLDDSVFHGTEETLLALSEQAAREFPVEFIEQNLHPINPFWADLPHCDIFSSMTPDLLHELHNGVFGEHIVSWATSATYGQTEEIDRRFRAMTPHPAIRHFKKGISLTTQWTGTERKNMEKVFLGILANTTDSGVQRAVRGILDFIYYAHFEVHCDDSLARLDAAWAAFHDDKNIFIELSIHEHFNINKLHKLKHYIDSIRSCGTADGFNTENTERLHIDLAKVGFTRTNKRADYIRQMTVWLRRQESIHKFIMYLQWAIPDYLVDISRDDDTLPSQVEDEEGELEVLPTSPTVGVTFAVAKTPGFGDVTVTSITTDFHAPDFLINLDDFLHSCSITPRLTPALNSTIPIYKQLSLTLPPISEVGSSTIRDNIRAVKAVPQASTSNGIKLARPGQFDTVLVRKHPREQGKPRTDADFGPYQEPLAYVDWFKPLTTVVPDLGMHRVSLSSRALRQNSSIIPVTDILRSCHLIPVFGRSVNPTWTSATVLDRCTYFYLNPYLRHHDFFLFRYLVDVDASKKAEEDRRVRLRLYGRAGRHS
ncbi:hypothetical protein C8J57DRAFT_1230967 [Mycena rebaudengoi]|nr:hypothetical protein C8J57DRAFT_1230967 [Mycena rebaudengoi]